MPEFKRTLEKGRYLGDGFYLKRDLEITERLIYGMPMGALTCYEVRIGEYYFESRSYDVDRTRKNLIDQIIGTYQNLKDDETSEELSSKDETLKKELSDLLSESPQPTWPENK